MIAVSDFANEEFFALPEVIEAKFSSTTPLRLLFLSNLLPDKGGVELLSAVSLLPLEAFEKVVLSVNGRGALS